jgi:hypothetical protein
MAYRLAELRLTAIEAPTATARKAAQAEHDVLIIKLWEQRASLPVAVESTRRLEASIATIQALLAKPSYWRPDSPAGTPEENVLAMQNATVRVVTTAAVMLRRRHELSGGPDDADLPFSKEEAKVRSELDRMGGHIIRRRLVGAAQHDLK